MAAAITVTPEHLKIGDLIDISGSGFAPSANMEISVGEAGVVILVKSGPTGDVKVDKVLKWTPTRAGIFSIVASDGTNRAETTIQVWTT